MDDFILRALIAGILIVVVAGPIGCVVVWRRMAYFGDSLAHSALLGTALGLITDLEPMLGVFVVGTLMSVLLVFFQRRPELSVDTLLGILSHGALAFGLVLLAYMQNRGVRVDLMAYLFGDILAVNATDLGWMSAGVLLVVLSLVYMWRDFLALTINEELARSEGVAVDRIRLLFMLLMTLVVAVSMKLVGILLITALLIIPAASARRFAQSPEIMVLLSVLFGFFAVVSGLGLSMLLDTPTGPSIVVTAVVLFFFSRIRLRA